MESTFQQLLIRYLNRSVNDTEPMTELTRHFTLVRYNKKHVLVREQQYHDFAYFLVEGAVRSYYLKEGLEVNTWFAFDGEMVGSLHTYRGLPAQQTIELVDDSVFVTINLRALKPLMNSHIQVSNFVRAILEEYAVFLEDRLHFSQCKSSMERYLHLLENEPQTFQRIPLTHIASYLGMSRETLSRLRSR